jgi:hypothetical protein
MAPCLSGETSQKTPKKQRSTECAVGVYAQNTNVEAKHGGKVTVIVTHEVKDYADLTRATSISFIHARTAALTLLLTAVGSEAENSFQSVPMRSALTF